MWSKYIRPTLGHLPLDSITRPGSRAPANGDREAQAQRAQPGPLQAQDDAEDRRRLGSGRRRGSAEDPEGPRGRKEEPAIYSEAELARLVTVSASEPERLALVLLLVHGGLRVSEVAALRWTDIDLQAGLMTIRHNFSAGVATTPKGGVAKPVGLTPELIAALRQVPRRIEQVLARRRGDAWGAPHQELDRLRCTSSRTLRSCAGPTRTCCGTPAPDHARAARLRPLSASRRTPATPGSPPPNATSTWPRRPPRSRQRRSGARRPPRRAPGAKPGPKSDPANKAPKARFNNAPRTHWDLQQPRERLQFAGLVHRDRQPRAGCNSVPEARVGNMASCTPDNGG
ncbi:MAG: tyrosine-type recombinase/integrase [Nannocystis sp.]|nr:tyrosine-type recombinase/integrase [Nannocystis sp.]